MSTNIPRITQKIFAQNAAEDDLLQFGSVLSGNATPSTSIAETQTEAYQTGWRSAVISDRNYPTLGEMNAVQQVPTQQLAYLFQKGIAEWDASTTYFANVSYCQVNGVIYKSLTDNNIGNNPTTDNGTNWIIADLSNKITNCILSAPNGVATYSGANLTLKSGLKVLLSNGLNSDGTLNNLELTFSSDETTIMSSTGTVFAFQDSSIIPGDVYFSRATAYYEQEEEPEDTAQSIRLWYKPSENQFYYKWGSGSINSWTKTPACVLGYCTLNDDNSAITSLTTYQPVELAKQQDLDGMWVYKNKTLFENQILTQTYNTTFDLSDYLPNDGNIYEILLTYMARTSPTAGSAFEIGYQTDFLPTFQYMMRNTTRTNSTVTAGGSSTALIGTRRTITIKQGIAANGSSGECLCKIVAYRKVR